MLAVRVSELAFCSFNAVAVDQMIEIPVLQMAGDATGDFVFLFINALSQVSNFQVLGRQQVIIFQGCQYLLC